ncbi:unnamed protein product [Schistocephalus solidus]|uniref:Transmembrane protein n=1 Tax=Schistocephalus solidus TaxID=70667 RepID=A0A183TB24_SCHSO|nr:unnamed protein product [Schistocephalus solidus]
MVHELTPGGLMVNLVSQSVFGQTGKVFLNVVILSAMATTTTAEVASISTIFINDIYATYLNPFCKRVGLNSCILCGKLRARFAEDSERCKCGSMAACEKCQDDMRAEETCKRAFKPPPTCSTHALYRRYMEQTRKLKFWITFTILGIVLFLALAAELAQVVTMSLMTYVSILGASAVGSLYLTFYWARLNCLAVLVGILSGVVFAVAGILVTHFAKLSFLGLGTLMSLVAGFIAPVIVTFASAKKLTEESELEVWEETRAIDNPLQPWPEIYAGDLGLRNAHLLTEGRPRLDDVQRAFGFSSTVLTRCVVSVVLLFAVIIPTAAVIPESLNYQMFQAWMHILLIWLAGSAIFCLIMPIVFEVENIYLAYKRRQEAERPDSFKAGQSATFTQGLVEKM